MDSRPSSRRETKQPRPSGVRLSELVAALSLSSDLGLGQPMEHVLRACLISLRLADVVGLDEAARAETYWVTLLATVCTAESFELGLATFEPGWRWSNDIRPLVGTDTCLAHHSGNVVAGWLHVETPDGHAVDLGPGDVFDLPPGHDGWVVGEEPVLMLDWGERIWEYAKPANETAGAAR